MSDATDYVLGQSERAARRLEIQDRQFAEPSEWLLDELALLPADRVVELGCGPGAFTRRVLRRLGKDGVVVGVDATAGLLEQAKAAIAGAGRFEPVLADVSEPGPWLDRADAVVGRAVLHHVPMAEALVGRLRAALKPGTPVGFVEPDFRSPVARLAYLEATGRPELAPLRVWAKAINDLYLARRISPSVGASLARAAESAGFKNVRTAWFEIPSDDSVLENLTMFYEEVRDTLAGLGILTAAEVDEQVRLLAELRANLSGPLPSAWGMHAVACEA
jgi:trans-aconitate methyltransferase